MNDPLTEELTKEMARSVELCNAAPGTCSSLGHLIARLMVSVRTKDRGDIVEIIKAGIGAGTWSDDRQRVIDTVKHHLGWYAAREVGTYERVARAELP